MRPLLTEARVPAAAAAVIRGNQEAVRAVGFQRRGWPDLVDTFTTFETGSVTKTFTALLLAEMAACGDVDYSDPIDTYLPPEGRPRRGERPITLLDLATHTAGLPRLPRNLFPGAVSNWLRDPYARYSRDDLYRATARLRPAPAVSPPPSYSTFGIGLLGQLLADAAGSSYPDLLAKRILRPLRMDDSGAPPAIAPGTRAATGHRRGRPVGPWHFGALAGAGAVRSTAVDLLGYLRAHLRPEMSDAPLAAALRATRIPRRSMAGRAGAAGTSVSLVWNHRVVGGQTLLWHTGGTGGFTAFVGFSPTANAAVAVLANATPTWRQPAIRAARRLFRAVLFPDGSY
nr:serine hydrolase domain-containing protein [Nocardiopsis mwathae]